MRLSIFAFSAFLPIALLTGCAGAQPERRDFAARSGEWRFGQKLGRQITTDHYVIYTTLTDETLLATFPELMERTFEYYRTLVPPRSEPAERMQIYLFATRPEWVYFTQKFTGPRAAVFLQIRNGGYSERGVTAIQYVAHQTTFPLMAHEGLHQYLYHFVNPQVPAWLNEGLAVLCEGQRWSGGGLKSFDPGYNPSRQNVLAEAVLRDELIPLPRLLETNAGRIVGDTSRRVGTYYAQVWALVLFLMEAENGKYADAFHELRESLAGSDFRFAAGSRASWAAGRARLGLHFRIFLDLRRWSGPNYKRPLAASHRSKLSTAATR